MSASAETSPSATPAYDALSTKQRAFVDAYLANGFNATRAARKAKYAQPHSQGPRLLGNVGVAAAIRERMAAGAMAAEEVLRRLADHAAGSAEHFLTFERVQRREKVWVPVAVAIEEKRFEVDVERETIAQLELTGKAREEADKRLAKLEAELVRLEVTAERDGGRHVEIEGPLVEETVARVDLRRMARAGKLHLVKKVKEEKDGGRSVELYDAQAALEKVGRHLGLFGPKGTADDPIHTEARVTSLVFTTPERGAAPDPDAD